MGSTSSLNKLLELIAERLWLKILIGLAGGLALGVVLGPSADVVGRETARTAVRWLAVPGDLFLSTIQMVVVPLVFSSIVVGVAGKGSSSEARRLMPALVGYFLFTTSVAIAVGMTATALIQPGSYIDPGTVNSAVESAGEDVPENAETEATPQERITALVPGNPLRALVQENMIQVVVLSLIFGLALGSLADQKSAVLIDVLEAVQSVTVSIVRWVMRFAPLAVFSLIAKVASEVGLEVLSGLSIYVLTVMGALALLGVFYLVIATLVGGKQLGEFLKAAREAQILAFSTSSSASVMPVTLDTAEEKLGVDPAVARVIVPLGATINMDGTALYQGAATLFLAQVYGVELGLAALVGIVVTATGASIGTPGAPAVGIIILATILQRAGIPSEGIALIIGVDRILDMSRTAINVTGDLTATTVMHRLNQRWQ